MLQLSGDLLYKRSSFSFNLPGVSLASLLFVNLGFHGENMESSVVICYSTENEIFERRALEQTLVGYSALYENKIELNLPLKIKDSGNAGKSG